MTPLGYCRLSVVAAVVALQGTAALAASVIEGKVQLPKPLHPPVLNKRYGIVSYGGVLSPFPPVAIVYVEGAFSRPSSGPTVQMVQKDLNFSPAIIAVQVNSRVEFPNLDDTYHNIFSYSPAKRFDLGRYRSDERPIPSVLFDVPGMVTVRCDIHEHMRAIILVLDTPHFVVSDLDGVYRLAGVPPGHFTLKAWVDSRTTLERPVDLQDGSTLHADFP
ncbi:MAG TPA: carboxypeptidase regulatory-like domain-containing protein [Opitutaceae bacterium]